MLTLGLETLVSNAVVYAEGILFVHHGLQEGDWEGGSEGAQTAADGWSVAVQGDLDELPILVQSEICSELVHRRQDLVAGHLDLIHCFE